MKKFVSQIAAGILGLWLALTLSKIWPNLLSIELKIIPGESSFLGIPFTKNWQILILIGFILGLINFFIKPVLKAITLPLRILTLGLFSLVINMGIIWVVDLLFLELAISGILSLFWVSVIIWGLNLFIPGLFSKKKEE